MSSLTVRFFLRPFLWGILAFRIVETVYKPFTLFHSKWETKLRYQGQLNHPTPRMTKKWCCMLPHVPWAPLHLMISPSLKRKRICYSFILFKIVCHFSMVTSQKHHYTQTSLHLNIHSLLRMLQYLWHGRVWQSLHDGIIYVLCVHVQIIMRVFKRVIVCMFACLFVCWCAHVDVPASHSS